MPPYPKPDVPYTGYSDLYFATEQQIRSRFSMANFDRGELSMSPGRVTFRGMEFLVDCPGVSAVVMVRKTFPWAVPVAIVVVIVVVAALNDPTFSSWRLPGVAVLAVILLAACLFHVREEWVEDTYAGPDGPQHAYFRRDPAFFGSSRKRTRALMAEIQEKVLAAGGGVA